MTTDFHAWTAGNWLESARYRCSSRLSPSISRGPSTVSHVLSAFKPARLVQTHFLTELRTRAEKILMFSTGKVP